MKLLKTAFYALALAGSPVALQGADKLSDLVDQSLTQSEAIPAWAAGETYQPGTERTAENPDLLDGDGNPAVFIWQMKDAAEHTAGATWDNAERDHWTPLGVYVAPTNSATSLVTAWDDTKTDYQQGDWVASGGALFVANANQTVVNDPYNDTGEHWTQYPAPRAYEYSIDADQFSSYQGTWADLINYYIPERGWTVTRLEADENAPPTAFDFNNDGSPITMAVGESVDYDGAQWVKAGFTTTTTLTGTTDADDQTTIPYSGDVSHGYYIEIARSTDRWLPQNYGDRVDEEPHYFQVLYDEGLARFELWAVGSELQNKPYRITIYGASEASNNVELPTALGGGSWGGAHANTFTTNGIWHGTNTGALAGAPLGNWSFQLDVMRVGEWIIQRYNADNSWIIYRRESYDGGVTWTAWRGV